jgi:DNA-binding HxlR family transcriptional regulator
MVKREIRDVLYPNCPIRNVISRFGDKWSMLILFTLHKYGVLRFRDLRRNIPDVSQKMLTETLRKLEADGLVKRKVYPEVPPKVEYHLTDRAETLIPLLSSLLHWAIDNMEDIIKDRVTYNEK